MVKVDGSDLGRQRERTCRAVVLWSGGRGATLSPGDIWQCSETFCGFHNWVGGEALGIVWVKTSDAAEHFAVYTKCHIHVHTHAHAHARLRTHAHKLSSPECQYCCDRENLE